MFKKRSSSASKSVMVEDLSQNLIPVLGKPRFAAVVHNLLSSEECANLIRRAEDEGFDHAMIQDANGEQILRKDIRSCGRCIIDDPALADAIFQRIMNAVRGTAIEKKIMHAPWMTTGEEEPLRAVGLNERLRFLRYEPGNFFAPHQDIRYVRGPEWGEKAGETSHITSQLYLNDKFKGGTTRFMGGRRYYDVNPKAGSVLLFDHDILHEGSKVTSGQKYSVRTDIMFTRQIESTDKQLKRSAKP